VSAVRPRLVLWDVDGTLVDSARLGRDAFHEAFERVTGGPPREDVPFAGRTDLEIALDMLEQSGVESGEELLDRFEEALVDAMAARVDDLRALGQALPGVEAVLQRLQNEPGVVQSLLTGNVERNALIKLSAFGLARYLDFAAGGYGSDHRRRGELVQIARRRAEERHGIRLESSDVVLVGDTPLDVAAALEGGARAVGVATGPYDEHALAAAGAHGVLTDLSNADAVIREVLA